MAETPKTGRELIMRMESEQDRIPALAQRCVDDAMSELGYDEIAGRTYDLAHRAALIGMRLAAEAIKSAQEVAPLLAALAPNRPSD